MSRLEPTSVRARFDRWGPVAVGALVTVALLAVSGRYGYHRDEPYYLCTRRSATSTIRR